MTRRKTAFDRYIASRARKQTEKKVRRVHYPAPYAILDIWAEKDGDPFAFPTGHPSSLPACRD